MDELAIFGGCRETKIATFIAFYVRPTIHTMPTNSTLKILLLLSIDFCRFQDSSNMSETQFYHRDFPSVVDVDAGNSFMMLRTSAFMLNLSICLPQLICPICQQWQWWKEKLSAFQLTGYSSFFLLRPLYVVFHNISPHSTS